MGIYNERRSGLSWHYSALVDVFFVRSGAAGVFIGAQHDTMGRNCLEAELVLIFTVYTFCTTKQSLPEADIQISIA